MKLNNEIRKKLQFRRNSHKYLNYIAAIAILLGGFFIFSLDRGNELLLVESFLVTTFLWVALYTKTLWKKYLFSFIGLIIYISIIFLFPIQFEDWAQFAFNIPILFAYLLPDLISPILTGILLAAVFSTHIDRAPNITGAIFGIITMAALSAIIGHLIRRLITQRNKYYYMSIRDSLTSLYSLNHVLELGQQMTEEKRKVMAIVFDIDNFKEINDTYGHLVGNKILIQIANILREKVSKFKSTIGRLGGDEFVILLEDISEREGKIIIADLLGFLQQKKFPVDSTLDPIFIGVSLGSAYYNGEKAIKIEELLHEADKLMYQNKFARRNIGQTNIASDLPVSTECQRYLKVIAEKDMYTYFHSRYTAHYAAKLANELGLGRDFAEQIYQAGLLHDIGKLLIPNEILRKPHRLSEAEYKVIQGHVMSSLTIIQDTRLSPLVVKAIKYHHERWDGRGYPFGRKDKDIPLEARILQIADAYSAMTIKRTYRNSLTAAEALSELENHSGTQFDPQLVDLFINPDSEENYRYLQVSGNRS